LHPRGAARLSIEDAIVGRFGPLHPSVADALDLGASVQVIELDLVALETVGKKTPKFRPIPKLPAVTRDLSLVLRDDARAGDIQTLIREAAGELCESVEVVTEFRGGSVPAGHRSVTFRVVYRDPRAASHPDEARTLTDKDVDSRQNAIIELAEKRLGATLRG
jgi:phenylalanyl-tRNA synthetase beta chain